MFTFFILALLMLVVALAFIVVPLLRVRLSAGSVSYSGSNIAIYRSQRRELDEELARGALTDAEHKAALGELSVRVVDEVPEQPISAPDAAPASQRLWWLVGVVTIIVPLSATLLYSIIGTPRAIEMAAAAPVNTEMAAAQTNAKTGEEPPLSDKQILAMVESLSQKMQQNPGDPRGWVLLARSQNALGRFVEASAAFEKAVALMPNDAQLLADYADATVMTQQGRFEGKPYALINQALKLEPKNMKALALAGTAELRMGNRSASLAHWEKLKTLVPKDSPDYREVESIIAEVKTTKLDERTPAPVTMAPTSTPAVQAPATNANIASSAKTGTKITGKVAITPAVISKLTPGDTLFVFARAKEGPRMPLAVLRVPAPKANAFPFTFELTEAMAMAPGMSLSSFAEVVIEARISKSGNAQLQPGDLSGTSEVVKPGAAGITVTIGKVAP